MTLKEITRTPLFRVMDHFVETVFHAGAAAAFFLASSHPLVAGTPFADVFVFAAIGCGIIACMYGLLFVLGALACLLLTCCGEARFAITPESS